MNYEEQKQTFYVHDYHNYLLAEVFIQIFTQNFLWWSFVILNDIAKCGNQSGYSVIISLHQALAVQSAKFNCGWMKNSVALNQVCILAGLLAW